jgi:prepilin-type N-terminal cleavage/methylation domain
MKKSENKAFTIVELMIVVVIIGILAAIIIPTVTDAITKAKVAEGKSNARNITTILYSEAVFQNRSYFEAYELDNIVSQAGYSLKSKTSEYRYWYDKDTNSMQYISLKEAFPKSGSAMNGVTYADSMRNSIEALSDAFPSYLYVDTYDDGITNLIYTVRNLPALARENNGAVDLSAIIENMDSILNDAINGLGNNADYNIETIKNHANNFTTDKTLYVDNNGIYTKAYALSKEDLSTAYEINGQKCVIDIANVVFNPQVTIIPNAVIIAKENNIDIEINIKVDIEIPDSVVLIQNGAFNNIASCQTITMKSNIAYDNDAFSTTAKQNISTRKENDNYTIYRIESGVITYTNMEARLNNGTVKKTNNITLSEGKFILDNTVIEWSYCKGCYQ